MSRAYSLIFVVASAFATAACGGKQSTPPPGPQETAGEPTEAPATSGGSISAEECQAQGGQVIGDIGDGAIHKPEYRCPTSGEPPIGHIAPQPGQPMAVEGAVCCR